MAGVLAAFRYRIYPKPGQGRPLKSHLSKLCALYNELRDLKINTWKEKHASLSENELRQAALDICKRDEGLQEIHSQVVQNVATRVYTAFKNYFKGRARFPKRKKERRYRSLTYPQSGFRLCGEVVEKKNKTELIEKERFYLSKVGSLRVFMHRPLEGRIKNLIVKYDAGEWYTIFVCGLPDQPKVPIEGIPEDHIKGGDLGLIRFLTLSDGRFTDCPRYLRKSEEKIKRLQRVLSRAKINSKNFRKLALRLARLHRRVFNQRKDYQNKTMASLFRENDVVVLEKLGVDNMLRNHCLAKSLQDAAFGAFVQKVRFKADLLGKWFVPVDPWGTTQLCHNCLEWVPKDLSEREHRCPNCGVGLQRDENSAKIIRRLGLLWLGYAPGRGVGVWGGGENAHGAWASTVLKKDGKPV